MESLWHDGLLKADVLPDPVQHPPKLRVAEGSIAAGQEIIVPALRQVIEDPRGQFDVPSTRLCLGLFDMRLVPRRMGHAAHDVDYVLRTVYIGVIQPQIFLQTQRMEVITPKLGENGRTA